MFKNIAQKLKNKTIFNFAFFIAILLGNLLFFGIGRVSAATYYVDSSITDTNIGSATPDFTTYNHATFETTGGADSVYKTIADVNLKTFSAGDSILFRKGQTWTDARFLPVGVGNVNSPITVSSFGSGVKPIINPSTAQGTDLRSTYNFLIIDGLDLRSSTGSAIRIYAYSGDSTTLTIRNCNISGTTYGIENSSTGANSLNLELSDNTILGGTNRAILTHSSTTLSGDISGNTFTSSSSSGFESNGNLSNLTISDNNFVDSGLGGIYLHGPNNSNISFIDNVISGNKQQGIYINASTGITFNGINISGGSVFNNGSSSLYNGIDLYQNNTGSLSNISISDVTVYGNTQDGIGSAGTVSGLIISNSRVHDNGVDGNSSDGDGIAFHGTTIGLVQRNIVYNNKKSQLNAIGDSILTANYNVIYNTDSQTGSGLVMIGDSHVSATLYNNTIVWTSNITDKDCFRIYNDVDGTIIAKNNTFYGGRYGINDTSNVVNMTENNNLYYGQFSGNVSGFTLAVNSIVSNPLFVNANTDFSLQNISPTVDVGTNVSLAADYAGNLIYGLPDIGAYEYQPTHTMVASADDPQIGETIRVYGNGKFRNTVDDSDSNATDTAKLSIVPQSSQTTNWLDLSISIWNVTGDYHKHWTENGDNLDHATETVHTIGDLVAGKKYTLTIDTASPSGKITSTDCIQSGICTADTNGEITFTYTGGYSDHIFDLTDNIPPAFSGISPAEGASVSGDDTITFTDSETTAPQCSLDNSHWNDCTSGVTSFSTLTGWSSLAEKNTFNLYLKDTDTAGNTGTAEVDNLNKADTQAPIRSDGSPSGKLSENTNQTTISIKTDEIATCKYATSSKDYDSMSDTFATVGGTTHSAVVTGLSSGNNYAYYVRCKDGAQNTNDTDYLISFSVVKNNTDSNTDNNSDKPSKAKIDSWSAKTFTDRSSCPEKLKLEIKGHNFKDNTQVKIGNDKATKTDKQSSTKLTATFCLKKLFDTKTDHKRNVSVQNTGRDNDKADKQLDLDDFLVSSRQSANKSASAEAQTPISLPMPDSKLKPNVCNYTVNAGDTLWSIASTVYGDPQAYPLIIEKNKEKYPSIGLVLIVGQELSFGCESNPQSSENVQGASDEKSKPTDSSNQSSHSQLQPTVTPPTSNFRWWNPFSWF